MKFHHIIEINDPLNPLLEPLTREQLWRGLVLRAESPKMFVPHLDECKLLERTSESVARELRYGTLTIRDRVNFVPQQKIEYQVPAQGAMSSSTLTMTIEEPQPDAFFVRFEYDDDVVEAAGSMEAFYNKYRFSAYQESDIDTIRVIRQLAQEGRFDAPGD